MNDIASALTICCKSRREHKWKSLTQGMF